MLDQSRNFNWKIVPLGDSALVLVFEQIIAAELNDCIQSIDRDLAKVAGEWGIIESVPAYATLTVYYDGVATSPQRLESRLREYLGNQYFLSKNSPSISSQDRIVRIPVCYGAEFGPDLEEASQRCGLTTTEFINKHTKAQYRVYMLGFLPGFPYLGGLDEKIAVPRHQTPRTLVPAGSVGIGGMQTGIYPLASPGGWQLIGRTPFRLFDPNRSSPSLLRPGDSVVFFEIDRDQLESIAAEQDGY